jgi:hypothetical protein
MNIKKQMQYSVRPNRGELESLERVGSQGKGEGGRGSSRQHWLIDCVMKS